MLKLTFVMHQNLGISSLGIISHCIQIPFKRGLDILQENEAKFLILNGV